MIQVSSRSSFYKRLPRFCLWFFFLQLYFFLVWFHKDFMRVEIFFLYFFFLECRPRLLKTEHPFNGYISLQTTTCHVAHNNHLLSSEFSYNVIRSPRQQFYTTAVISGCKLHNLVIINSQTNDKEHAKCQTNNACLTAWPMTFHNSHPFHYV